ncbi:serine hydrolase [Streptomyces sp. NPDC059788]|uniref:serine hydrolase n=1 Tax=Streptomyces sp. NPDC059788 TaxID=3346948 RepID=UPI00365E98FD
MRWVSRATTAAMAAGTVVGLVAAATPSVAASKSAAPLASVVRCTSTDHGLAEKLSRDVTKALAGRKSMVSLSFYDRPTGTRCVLDDAKAYDAASTAKTIILGALLYHRGGTLPAAEDALARKMIIDSDNAAATTLWKRLSDLKDPAHPNTVKVQEFLDRAELRHTVPDKEGFWGLTQITAGDQAALLRIFTGTGGSVLGGKARAYALDLMKNVRSDQRWGATAGAPLDSVVHVKNGWLQRSRNPDVDVFDRGDWKVNSTVALTGNGYDSGLVVLSENNRVPEGHPENEGWDYGIATIETVSRAIYRDVYPGTGGYTPGKPAPEDAEPLTAPGV